MLLTASRLAQHRGRILQVWRERSGGLPGSGALERELASLLEAIGRVLAGEATPEEVAGSAGRLASRDAPGASFAALELLQQVATEVLEADEPLPPPARTALLGTFAALRASFVAGLEGRLRRLERTAARSEERYLVAARAAGFAIWDWELQADQVHWSRSLENLFGHPVEALSSLDLWLEHVHPADRERVSQGLRHVVEGGGTRWHDTLQLLRRDGTWAAVLARGWVLHDEAGDPVRMVGGIVDVTEQWRLENELRRSEEELREAVRVRDDFLSIASHELRTPLSALRLQIQSMNRGPLAESIDERVRLRLKGAERSVERMTQLIDDLLDVSRLNAGRLTLVPEAVNLSEVVGDVVARFQSDAQRAGSSIGLSLAEVVGTWDRGRVDQVVSNLLSNAIKYGSGRPIELTVESAEGWAVLRVKDQGIGISAEQQARLFQRFERAVSPRHFGGFGLGLWIVKRILDAMGGAVRVTSALGEGATFEVRLPPGKDTP